MESDAFRFEFPRNLLIRVARHHGQGRPHILSILRQWSIGKHSIKLLIRDFHELHRKYFADICEEISNDLISIHPKVDANKNSLFDGWME